MGDAIVLPGEIVESLAHESAVHAKILFLVLVRFARPQVERLLSLRRNIGLKDQPIRQRLRENLLAGAVLEDVDARQIAA